MPMKRRCVAPLLITGCDCCVRRRACMPFRFLGLWLCKPCIRRFARVGIKAMDEFQRQGR
jgi:hypothetical protein